MKYLILESHAAYCVALGEDGRCIKCANMRYEVGDRVEDVIELKLPERRDSRRIVRIASLCAGLAACLCIAFFGWYQPNYAAYGTMRMSINPDVELTLSRTERDSRRRGPQRRRCSTAGGDGLLRHGRPGGRGRPGCAVDSGWISE